MWEFVWGVTSTASLVFREHWKKSIILNGELYNAVGTDQLYWSSFVNIMMLNIELFLDL